MLLFIDPDSYYGNGKESIMTRLPKDCFEGKPPTEEEERNAFKKKLAAIIQEARYGTPFHRQGPEERERPYQGLDDALDDLGDNLEKSGMTDEQLMEEIRLGREEFHQNQGVKKDRQNTRADDEK